MARWVTGEIGKENLPVDLIKGITERSVLEITVLAAGLQANEDQVTHRNWSGLVQLLSEHNAPLELQEVIVEIQKRDAMHDKFWRYMKLFVEVSAQ